MITRHKLGELLIGRSVEDNRSVGGRFRPKPGGKRRIQPMRRQHRDVAFLQAGIFFGIALQVVIGPQPAKIAEMIFVGRSLRQSEVPDGQSHRNLHGTGVLRRHPQRTLVNTGSGIARDSHVHPQRLMVFRP